MMNETNEAISKIHNYALEEIMGERFGRYALWRMSFESKDKDGSLTLTQIKEEIDKASLENGWVLITTHMGESAWANSYDRS